MLAGLYNATVLAFAKINPFVVFAAGGGDHGDGGHGGAPHLPNLINVLHELGILSDSAAAWATYWANPLYAGVAAIILSLIALNIYAKRDLKNPGPFQNAAEALIEGMYNFIYSIMGKEARRYIPFLGTLFFYILVMNWMGLVPGLHSPTTGKEITLSMAAIVFLYAQWTGIRRLGVLGYLDHLAGQPRDAVTWALVPLMFLLHLVGELVKPVSLGLRLFGNITGEDTLVAVFVGLGITLMALFGSPVGLPLHAPFILLGLLLSTIQALVFTLLSTIYILMMLPHEEHEH